VAGNDLTVKQEKFSTAFIETGNASEAYRQSHNAANMNAASINREAARLLDHPKVAGRIEELRAELRDRHKVTADRIAEELSHILFADPGSYFDWGPGGVTVKEKSSLTPEQRRVISQVEQTVTDAGGTIRVKLHSKIEAADKLARLMGFYKELHEHSGPDGGPIQIERIERVIVDPADTNAASLPAPAGKPKVQGS
jgi:phage terminase small subunit